jgi:succinate dehydrogenase / fumarate reductase flavoprotein subunit
MKESPIIVIGSGISGLTACIALALSGQECTLVSEDMPQQSSSNLSNSSLYIPKNHTTENHFADEMNAMSANLLDGSLAQDFIRELPRIFEILGRIGVRFDTSPEGFLIDYGVEHPSHQSYRAGYLSGRVILKKLEALLQYFIATKKITTFFNWRFLSPILDSKQICRGVVVMHKPSMELMVLPSNAVVIASGGYEGWFESNLKPHALGEAMGSLFKHGAMLANPEMIQFDACFSGPGGSVGCAGFMEALAPRFFINQEGSPRYFLEDIYLEHIGPLPQVVLSRAMGRLKGNQEIFVDIDNNQTKNLFHQWDGFEKHLRSVIGESTPLKSIPVKLKVSDTLGGLWTTPRFLTSIPGILAAGRVQYQLKGAHQPQGTHLLASLYSGLKVSENALLMAESLKKSADLVPNFVFDEAQKAQFSKNRDIMDQRGIENIYLLADDARTLASKSLSLAREGRDLKKGLDELRSIQFRLKDVVIHDRSRRYNQELLMYRSLESALPLIEASIKAALYRTESRGVHERLDYPLIDEKNFQKTTRVRLTSEGPRIEYEDIAVEFAA